MYPIPCRAKGLGYLIKKTDIFSHTDIIWRFDDLNLHFDINFTARYDSDMNIYFNPYYDSSVFLTEKDCGLGKAYHGKTSLLNELELRAGLTVATVEDTQRIIKYMKAMQEAVDEAAATGTAVFFEDSFKRDDFGTAELLLKWRDTIKRVGWNGKPVGKSEKIKGLSAIEKHFDCPGLADRWQRILQEAKTRAFIDPGDRICVQTGYSELEPFFQELFDALNAKYTTPIVEYLGHNRTELHYPSSIRILSFKNDVDAHEWIASQDYGQNDVVAGADTAMLGDMLYTLGRPRIGAADEGIGAIMRLLPLGMALFKDHVDIATLHPYLQTRQTPLNALHCKVTDKNGNIRYIPVSRKLYDHICAEGGLGKNWTDILNSATYAYDGTPLGKDEIDTGMVFINMWERSKGTPGEAPVDDVREFLKELSLWAQRHLGTVDKLFPQYNALMNNCQHMLSLLSIWTNPTIPVDKLTRWATHICAPINISTDYARLGSVNIVDSVADIFSSPDRLIWYAASTSTSYQYEFEFLSKSEKDDFNVRTERIPTKEFTAMQDKAYKKEGLCRAKEVIIVTCDRIGGVETVQDATLAELSAMITPVNMPKVIKTAKGKVIEDKGKAIYHSINASLISGFKRKQESYSSINTLIQRPLDYILDYVLGYRQYGIDEVADVATVEGTAAHAYIETLGKICGYDTKAMLAKHNSDFQTLLDSIITEKGIILFLEENKLELESFRVGLKDSVDKLIALLIDNDLEIVDNFEYEITSDIAPIGKIYAKIDCLLKDKKDGKYVILDFKWNSGSTYERKIAENNELQLAIYQKLVETELGEVKFYGYYCLPRRILFTPHNTLAGDCICVINDVERGDLFALAAASYKFRMRQLLSGILEEGEGMELINIDYNNTPGLYPLESDYENEALKARAYGKKNIVLKGGLE